MTIREIAAQVHVSHPVVSAVLNDKTNCRVSPEKRALILKIARESGYRQNFGYRLMRGGKTRTMALVTSSSLESSDLYMRDILLRLLTLCNDDGYVTYVDDRMGSDGAANLDRIRELLNRGAEHFIFLGCPCGIAEIETELLNAGVSMIGFRTTLRRTLDSDSRAASIALLRFLCERADGAVRVAIPWTAERTDFTKNPRTAGIAALFPGLTFAEQSERYFFPLPCALIPHQSELQEKQFLAGEKAAGELAALPRPPRGVLFLTDYYALGAARWYENHGVKVGRDVFLAGFNNELAGRFAALPISSAEHDVKKIAERLFEEVFRNDPIAESVPLQLVFRTWDDTNDRIIEQQLQGE